MTAMKRPSSKRKSPTTRTKCNALTRLLVAKHEKEASLIKEASSFYILLPYRKKKESTINTARQTAVRMINWRMSLRT
jgi:hypothetical protein